MNTEPQRTCPSCGNEFSAAMEFCPVCMLRKGLAGGVESGESSFEEAAKPTSVQALQRFEHYELVTGEDGKPVELGRGAMGVTYKAFDVDLHCPVTLKVISERYLGEESARLRFLREARAATSARHPNVASVFHLGTIGQNYFSAMEFVEGETLEKLIKRSGRLELRNPMFCSGRWLDVPNAGSVSRRHRLVVVVPHTVGRFVPGLKHKLVDIAMLPQPGRAVSASCALLRHVSRPADNAFLRRLRRRVGRSPMCLQ